MSWRDETRARMQKAGQTPAWLRASQKHCSKCREWLPLGAFRRNPNARSGRHSWCKECELEATRRWRAKNPEKIAEANAKRRAQPRVFVCVECGEPFRSRLARITCGEECRRARHRRFDRVRDHASRAKSKV